jgi:hypothetical protein
MRSRKVLAATAAVALSALGLAVLTPTAASASTGTVMCYTIYHNPITHINTYECELGAGHPTGEFWTGPGKQAGSDGTPLLTGTCRQVSLYYAYYPHVTYLDSGVPSSAVSGPFLCPDGGV